MIIVVDPAFEQRLNEVADRITVALDQLIPPASGPEAQLMRAMRHGALSKGKRLRPFITIEVGRMFGAQEKALLRAAAAVECMHAYSLIHDDLPCMDDDDLRRGKPTVHVRFGVAVALLAFAAGEVTGAAASRVEIAAAAVEMIHAYSLVHDDLPCMDDDVLRRGKPTVHVQFGEATALLVGDARSGQQISECRLDPGGDIPRPRLEIA